MPDLGFRLMSATFTLIDLLLPSRVEQRIGRFGIREGMTVVDYGCGPGRYATRIARLVGPAGRVFAVDIHELALDAVRRKMARERLDNIVPVLAHGYDSGLPDQTADVVCVLDMFFGVNEPTTLLREVHRIIRPDGLLILDDGHQSRATTLRKLNASALWRVEEESEDHLKCRPVARGEGQFGPPN
jgi:ubiquinone/menaquinone biosynthesis C-methylase UbiE